MNCEKELNKKDSLKTMVADNDNSKEIYFCCFECFEKYNRWPSLKKKPKQKNKNKNKKDK
jgi:hypothetical protein